MINKFSKLMDDLCYSFSLAEIKIENEKQDDLSHNSALYKKIICKESGKHTISSIAKLLAVKTTAVTQKVNELEQKKYVVRKQCVEDKRVSYLYGAEKSCPCKDMLVKRDEYVFAKLQKEYTPEEVLRFLEMLEKTTDSYSEYDTQIEER